MERGRKWETEDSELCIPLGSCFSPLPAQCICQKVSHGAPVSTSASHPAPRCHRLWGHGLLLQWPGFCHPLHAQVWECRLWEDRVGLQCVWLAARGLLHAGRLVALLQPLWCFWPPLAPQCHLPDGLPQRRGAQLVAEPVYVLWGSVPSVRQSHPPPG